MSTINLGNHIKKLFLGVFVLMAGTSQAMSLSGCLENIQYGCNRLGTGVAKTIQDLPIVFACLVTAGIIPCSEHGLPLLDTASLGKIALVTNVVSIGRYTIPEWHYPSNTFIRTILEHPLALSLGYFLVKASSDRWKCIDSRWLAAGLGMGAAGYVAEHWSSKWLGKDKAQQNNTDQKEKSDVEEEQ